MRSAQMAMSAMSTVTAPLTPISYCEPLIHTSSADCGRRLQDQVTTQGHRIDAGETNLMQLSNSFAIGDGPANVSDSQQQLPRRRLPEPLRSGLATASCGDVIGPIRIGDGWIISRVETIQPAELDGQLQAQLEAQLYGEWLRERSAQIRLGMLPDPDAISV